MTYWLMRTLKRRVYICCIQIGLPPTLFSLSVAPMNLLLILAVSILSPQVQDVLSTDKPVYFSLIVSYGEYGFNSSGGIPAINIALEQIRARNILPGYNLTYEVEGNSKVRSIIIASNCLCLLIQYI